MKKILLLLLLMPSISFAHCPLDKMGISCKTEPCLGMTNESVGAVVFVTCSKVFEKQNNKWVFSYYSLLNTVQTTGKKNNNLITFESRVIEIN